MTRSPHKGLLIAAALVLGLLAFAPGTASAQDPNLDIGGSGATGTDPVQLGSNVNTVTVTPMGSNQAATPWFLILGIPVGSVPSPLPAITTVNGNAFDGSVSDTGKVLKSGSADAYTLLGLVGDNSENFTNWSGASSAGTTQWELIEYTINNPMLPGNNAANTIVFNSNLPADTYVIAEGTNGSLQFSTPFTTAGHVGGNTTQSVPEPSTMVLALTGLVGAGFAGLRRLRRRQPATV